MNNTTRLIRDTSPFTHAATLIVGIVLGTFIVTTPSTVVDGSDAQAACDGDTIVKSGPEIASTHVIVNLDGDVKRLPTPYARSLDPNAVWVIGVCKKDVQW